MLARVVDGATRGEDKRGSRGVRGFRARGCHTNGERGLPKEGQTRSQSPLLVHLISPPNLHTQPASPGDKADEQLEVDYVEATTGYVTRMQL